MAIVNGVIRDFGPLMFNIYRLINTTIGRNTLRTTSDIGVLMFVVCLVVEEMTKKRIMDRLETSETM